MLCLGRELLQQRRDIRAGAFQKDLGCCHDPRRVLSAERLALESLRNKHEYPRRL